MPYNDTGLGTFLPLGNAFAQFPAITETYVGLTTAQLTALGYSSTTLTAGSTSLVQSARSRNTMTIYVPTDQQNIVVDNQTPVSSPPTPGGFTIPVGVALQLAPYNDPLYATVAPQGAGPGPFLTSTTASGTSVVFYTTT